MAERTSEAVLVSLLNDALMTLESHDDLWAQGAAPSIAKALGSLDDLNSRLGHHDSLVFPRGARARIEVIRGGLRIGDRNRARNQLQALAEELRREAGE
jgi:hypothetical protein